MLKFMLEGNGHVVVGTVFNGLAAIELYKSLADKPRIILMDHRMPIKDGLEASKEILLLDSSAHIIFTTADSEIIEEALKIGAFCVIKKPFDFNELFDSIDRASKTCCS